MVDMPIRELEKYMGTNPRPADFEEYWEKAVAEMKATDPRVEIKKADFSTPNIDCFDLYFTGVGGARIYAKFLRPKHIEGKIPAIITFHGYTGASDDWTLLLPYAASNAAVFAMDARGQGGKSQDPGGVCGNTYMGHIIRGLDEEDPQKLLFRSIMLDAAELAGIAMEMDFIDENKVYVKGGSMAAGLSLACASLEPRIAKAAVFFPFLCDYQRVWYMGLGNQAYGELKEYFRNFDPRHEREEEIFTKLGYIDVQHHAPRIKADVLLMTTLSDTTCPPSTQYAMYNKLNCRKKHILYPDYGHEYPAKGLPDILYNFLINDKW